jgi:hypothetical protein
VPPNKTKRADWRGMALALLQALYSEEYHCPGDHGTKSPREYAQQELERDSPPHDSGITGSCIFCGHEVWLRDYHPPLELDTESGYLLSGVLCAWPVADGPCVRALGLEDDVDDVEYDHNHIWGWLEERTRLMSLARSLSYKHRVDIHAGLLALQKAETRRQQHGKRRKS